MLIESFRKKLQREINKVLADPEFFKSANWFDLWHAHVDWDSRGRESESHRRVELRALFLLHKQIRQCMAVYSKPYQQWLLISQSDSGEDSVYLHSANPNKTRFPHTLKASEVDWSARPPRWLLEHVDPARQRVGRILGNRMVLYVVEDGDGANLPL